MVKEYFSFHKVHVITIVTSNCLSNTSPKQALSLHAQDAFRKCNPSIGKASITVTVLYLQLPERKTDSDRGATLLLKHTCKLIILHKSLGSQDDLIYKCCTCTRTQFSLFPSAADPDCHSLFLPLSHWAAISQYFSSTLITSDSASCGPHTHITQGQCI